MASASVAARGKGSSQFGRFLAWATVPSSWSTAPGDPTPAPASSSTATPADSAASLTAAAIASATSGGPPSVGVGCRAWPITAWSGPTTTVWIFVAPRSTPALNVAIGSPLAPEADGVQVLGDDLLGARGAVVDVVVLGVEVAAGKGIQLAGGECMDELRRQLGRRPRRIVAEAVSGHLRSHEAGADGEDGDAVRLELPRQGLAEAVHRRLAGAVGGRRASRKVGGAARDVDDASAAARDHPRDHGTATQIDTKDVDLEDVPPLVRIEVPGGVLPDRDPRVVDQEIERAELLFGLRHHALDVRPLGDVGLDRKTADLGG